MVLPEEAVSGDDPAERYVLGVLVRQSLARLPRQQRAVLVLRYCEDLSEAEVAALLGCYPGRSRATRTAGCARRGNCWAANSATRGQRDSHFIK
jgi:DNA-directed RNA polymerase specialized sigma24 family protein